MQIQLKQSEIEAGLRDFITKQGINLNGREVSIVFTAGRKSGGLTADVTISEDVFPDVPSDFEVASDGQIGIRSEGTINRGHLHVVEPITCDMKPGIETISAAVVGDSKADVTTTTSVPELPPEVSAFDANPSDNVKPEHDEVLAQEVAAEAPEKKTPTTSLFGA